MTKDIPTRVPEWTAADRLRKARETAGLDQSQMAAAIKVSRNTVSNYERGETEAPMSKVIAWSDATGVALEWIAFGRSAEWALQLAERQKAPSEDGAFSTVSTSVRPEGFEPPTFWSVADETRRGAWGLAA